MPKGIYSRQPTACQIAKQQGATTYEGKPCKMCGSKLKYVSGQHCVQCKKRRNEKWRNIEPEYHTNWCKENRVVDRSHKSRWREHNRVKANQASSLWRKNNKDRHAYYQSRRRARKLNAPGTHTFKQWRDLVEKFNSSCLCCGISESELLLNGKHLTEDHIIPLTSPQTSNDISNIQPLCFSCNVQNYQRYRRCGRQIDFREW